MQANPRVALILFLLLIGSLSLGQASQMQEFALPPLKPGVVVEQVAKYSTAERAGLSEGDVILRWSRGGDGGEIHSPFDLPAIEIEQAPRGTVALEGFHGNEGKIWRLGSDGWGVQTHPNFRDSLYTIYSDGQALARAGKLNEAAERWRSIAPLTTGSDPSWLRPWVFFRIARMQQEAGQWKGSDQYYQEAIQAGAAAGPAVTAQLHRSLGDAFKQGNDWTHAEQNYQQAIGTQDPSQESLTRALDLDNLGSLVFKRGDLVKADEYYQQALHIRERLAPGGLAVAVSLNKLAELEEQRGNLDKAGDFGQRALTIAEQAAPGGLQVAGALGNLGDVAFDRGNFTGAEDYYRRSLNIREELAPGSLDVAMGAHRLGWLALYCDDPDKAEKYFSQALAIREKLAPSSLDVAQSLHGFGSVFRMRGDLTKAEDYYREALAIRNELAPGSLDVAASLNILGNLARDRGDLPNSEEYLRQALAIRTKLAPGSLYVASIFNSLGLIAWQRGDLAEAERYYLQALTIQERLAPNSLTVATTFNNLGVLAWQRGDLVGAEKYELQGFAIRQKSLPGSPDVAMSLSNLMLIALEKDDLPKADELSRQVHVIYQKFAPGSLSVARSFENLALVARQRGDLAQAQNYYRQAIAIRERLAPVSVDSARNFNRLGAVDRDLGDLARTEQDYRRAFAIWEKLAPGSSNEAEALAGLAAIAAQRDQLDEADHLFRQALEGLEKQTTKVGGAESIRAGFRAKYENVYLDYIGLLVRQGKTAEAFEVLERSRARTLLEMLATAHVDLHHGADPALVQKEHSLRENITAMTDRRMRMLSDQHREEQIAEIDREIGELRDEYQAVEAQLRAASPAYAALTQPEPLTTDQVQKLLDGDTVLLEYSLGEKQSYVFVVTRDSVVVRELSSRAEIERIARNVYDSITARNRSIKNETIAQRQARWSRADSDYPEIAGQLTKMILDPVMEEIQNKRLVVVSDGALQYVPFAALPAPEAASQAALPLMVQHEIVNLPSASILAVLRRQEKDRQPPAKSVAVFADPVFTSSDPRVGPGVTQRSGDNRSASTSRATTFSSFSSSDDLLTRSVRDVGLKLSRLPFTRREAEAIFSLVPSRQTMKALDFNATRKAATASALSQYRIVHFATHGLLDSQQPELSGLVLSLVESHGKPQSGFLTLEDIYNLNMPAQLVVLSACETGLGKEIKGEGLIGLTRGFMYAGASRVMASLWSVNDVATAELMGKFYQGVLRQGLPPASALRNAQRELWQHTRWKSPYYWAAFQLQGDWR